MQMDTTYTTGNIYLPRQYFRIFQETFQIFSFSNIPLKYYFQNYSNMKQKKQYSDKSKLIYDILIMNLIFYSDDK